MSIVYKPKRLHVMQLLQELIEGAHWDGKTLEGRVSRGKILIGDEIGEGPWVNIIEAPRPDFPSFGGGDEARADDWVILLEGVVERPEDGSSDPAYWLQAEVELQIAKVFLMNKKDGRAQYPDINKKFAGMVTTIRPNPPVIRPIEHMMGRVAFYQPLTIGIADLLASPFVKIEQ